MPKTETLGAYLQKFMSKEPKKASAAIDEYKAKRKRK